MYTLTSAVFEIANRVLIPSAYIVGIQFEDGSGRCFNYQVKGCSEWKFIRL